MNLLRVTVYLLLSQCVLAGAALAKIVNAIPEPATLSLLIVGAGGVAVARKLCRRKYPPLAQTRVAAAHASFGRGGETPPCKAQATCATPDHPQPERLRMRAVMPSR